MISQKLKKLPTRYCSLDGRRSVTRVTAECTRDEAERRFIRTRGGNPPRVRIKRRSASSLVHSAVTLVTDRLPSREQYRVGSFFSFWEIISHAAASSTHASREVGLVRRY